MAKPDVDTYRRVFREAPAAITILTGREGRVELISDEALRVRPTKVSPGQTMREAWPELEGQGFFELVEQAFDTGKPVRIPEAVFEVDHHGKLITTYWNLSVQPRLDEAGKAIGVVIFGIDITETVKNRNVLDGVRQRLQFAQEAGGVGTFEWIIATNEVIWTEQLEDQFNIPRGSFEGTYEAWVKRVHPDDVAMAQRWVRRAVEERVQMNMELRIRWPDGTERWQLARAKVLEDADGKPQRFIGMSIDITERKELESRLKDANDRITNILEEILDGKPR